MDKRFEKARSNQCTYCLEPKTRADRSYCLACYQLRSKIASDDYRNLMTSNRRVVVEYHSFLGIMKVSKPLLYEHLSEIDGQGQLSNKVHYFYTWLPDDPTITAVRVDKVI